LEGERLTAANPPRNLTGDAACVRDVIAPIGGPVVLVAPGTTPRFTTRSPPTCPPRRPR
jgi:hypothetical protein